MLRRKESRYRREKTGGKGREVPQYLTCYGVTCQVGGTCRFLTVWRTVLGTSHVQGGRGVPLWTGCRVRPCVILHEANAHARMPQSMSHPIPPSPTGPCGPPGPASDPSSAQPANLKHPRTCLRLSSFLFSAPRSVRVDASTISHSRRRTGWSTDDRRKDENGLWDQPIRALLVSWRDCLTCSSISLCPVLFLPFFLYQVSLRYIRYLTSGTLPDLPFYHCFRPSYLRYMYLISDMYLPTCRAPSRCIHSLDTSLACTD